MPNQYSYKLRRYGNRTLFVQNRSFQLIPTDLFEEVCEPSLREWRAERTNQLTLAQDSPTTLSSVLSSGPRPQSGVAKATMWRAIQIRQWIRRQAAQDLLAEIIHLKSGRIVRRLWRDKALRAFWLAKQQKGSLSPVARWSKGRKRKHKSRLIKNTCVRGHPRVEENLARNGACKICVRITKYNWRLKNLEKDRASNRLYDKKQRLARGGPKRKPRVAGEGRVCTKGHQLEGEQAAKERCPVCLKIANKKYKSTAAWRTKHAARMRQKRREAKNGTTDLRLGSD